MFHSKKVASLYRLVVCFVVALFFGGALFAQNVTVKGTVTDDHGEPVVGAGVLVKGTKHGIATNLDGKYTLVNVPANATLLFTSMNYKNVEVLVKGRTTINVTMEETAIALKEAVVTAEFGMKRVARAVGSAVQNVKASDVLESGRESFVSALEGRVAGMTVTNTSGAPGASTSVVLRSITSISGSNQPLYVIDGVPMNNSTFDPAVNGFADNNVVSSRDLDFSSRGNDLNPDDIESMTVLKGAAAAALYGSDASNGAIIITTKKGSAGKGKVSYSNSFRWDKAYGYPKLQDEYANGRDGITNYYFTSRYGGRYPSDVKLYDNVSALLRTAFSHTQDVSVEGGTDKITVRGSASYTDQQGVIKTTDYTRLNVGLSGKAQITKWLNFDSSIGYTNTTNTKASKGSSGVLAKAIRWPMTDDMSNYITPEGKMSAPALYTDTDLLNPLYALYKNRAYDESERVLVNVGLNVTPSKHTFVMAKMGWDVGSQKFQYHVHPYYGNPSSSSYGSGSYNLTKANFKDKTLNVLAGYNNNWGKFTFAGQVGYHQQENGVDRLSTSGSQFLDPDFYGIANCTPSTISTSTRVTKRRIQAISGQVELGYNNLVFLTARARNDWSSTLPKSNRSYFYPALEGSFIATELPFLKNNDWVTYFKLRGAIARVGKDAQPLSVYPALEETGMTGSGYGYGYKGPNPKLKPEMTTSYEIGFEARFWQDRVNMDFTYYWTKCKDQYITDFRLSYATGFVLNDMNVGNFTTHGWDMHIDADIVRSQSGIRWNVGLNLSSAKSKVTYLPENVSEYYNAYTWLYTGIRNGIKVGSSVTSITGYKYERNNKGQILIDPGSGAPVINTTDWQYLGDREPKLRLNITTSVSYKNFRLSALLTGRIKATVANITKWDMMATGSSKESAKMRKMTTPIVFNGVLKNGLQDTDHPTQNNIAMTWESSGSTIGYLWTGCAEDWVENNVNYLHLSELRLSYNVPSKWLEKYTKKFVSSANIWVRGTDLFTWTNYSGIDAVGNSNSASMGGSGGVGFDYWGIPSPRGFAFGLSLTF